MQNAKKSPVTFTARRVGAFWLDILIIFAVCLPCGVLIQKIFNIQPQTGPDIWRTLLWNFSLPSWLYFLWSDHSRRGRTIGKRIFKLRVVGRDGERLGWGRALARTAIKLLPWEIIHFSAFALSKELSEFTTAQYIGLLAGNALSFIYLITAIITHGRRSIHDLAAGTEIRFENFRCSRS